MINPELEKLIETAFSDGKITEREIEILKKKAEQLGVDLDEFELYLENKIGIHKNSNSSKTQILKIVKNPIFISIALITLGLSFLIIMAIFEEPKEKEEFSIKDIFNSLKDTSANVTNDEAKVIVNEIRQIQIVDYEENIINDYYTYPWFPTDKNKIKGNYFGNGYYCAFNKGDTLILSMSSKNNNFSLIIFEVDTTNFNNIVYLKQIEDTLNLNVKIYISKKCILGFNFSSKNKNTTAQIKLFRIPNSKESENFISELIWKEIEVYSDKKLDNSEYVTSEWQNVITNSIVSCNSRTKIGGSTRNIIPISPIPDKTIYLVYRIVCNNLNHKANTENTSDLLSELSDINPYTAIASTLLSTINQVPGTAICDIYLLSNVKGRDNFLNKEEEDNVIDCIKSYSVTGINNHNQVIKDIDFDSLYIGFRNKELTAAVDISVNVIAAVSVKKWKYIQKVPIIDESYLNINSETEIDNNKDTIIKNEENTDIDINKIEKDVNDFLDKFK